MLICPICATPLNNGIHTVTCEQNHCFDKARQGYLNLLPVQQKHSRSPGDNQAMVEARNHFLGAGHYAPLANKLTALAQEYTKVNTWLDVGCGEGYYTSHLAKAFPTASGYGLDISKEAIKQACKKNRQLQWLVASMAKIPLQNNCCDLVTTVFSPFNWDEAARILSKQGGILRLGPATNHLIELREKLYDEVKRYEDNKHLKQLPPHILHIDSHELSFSLSLTNASDRKNLLAMTPHGWRASEDKRNQVINNPLTVTVAVRYDYFRPT